MLGVIRSNSLEWCRQHCVIPETMVKLQHSHMESLHDEMMEWWNDGMMKLQHSHIPAFPHSVSAWWNFLMMEWMEMMEFESLHVAMMEWWNDGMMEWWNFESLQKMESYPEPRQDGACAPLTSSQEGSVRKILTPLPPNVWKAVFEKFGIWCRSFTNFRTQV